MPAARQEARAPNKHFASRTLTVRVARKQAKNDFSRFRARRQGRAGRLAGLPARTRPEANPQNCRKCVFWPLFGKIGGVAPSDRPRRPRVPGICQPGAAELPPVCFGRFSGWRGRFLGQVRRPRVPGICQPGAPDPPGGTPQTPPKAAKKACFGCFSGLLDWPRRPESLESARLGPQTLLGVPPQTPRTHPKNQSALHGRGFGVLLYCLTARGQ